MNELLNTVTQYTLDTTKGQAFIKQLDEYTLGAFSKTIATEIHALSSPEYADMVGDDFGNSDELLLLIATLAAQCEHFYTHRKNGVRTISAPTMITVIANAMAFAVQLGEVFERDLKSSNFGEIMRHAPNEKLGRIAHWMGREEFFKSFTTSMAEVSYRVGGQVYTTYLKELA